MATRQLELTNKWLQLTTGKEEVLLQVMSSGGVFVFDSMTRPDDEAVGYFIAPLGSCRITPPTAAWIRAKHRNAMVVYS